MWIEIVIDPCQITDKRYPYTHEAVLVQEANQQLKILTMNYLICRKLIKSQNMIESGMN